MILCRLISLICLGACLLSHPVWACRYNVRETGFADLGIGSYSFYGYVREKTPEDIVSLFRQISYTSLLDSNIKVDIINVDLQKDHPAMKYLELWKIQSFPSAVLVSPDGQSKVMIFEESGISLEQTLQSAIKDIVSSPIREKILKQVIDTYGVVLLIEGTDVEENRRVRRAAFEAIEKIKRQMKLMPKTISHPPALIVMDQESLAQEHILLWSLGLDPDNISAPYAAVLYGRVRWIGPLLNGREISESVLADILYVIGEDCECGLDWQVLQGTMLPMRWDNKIQARTAKALGFDPENPMIRMEISQILIKGSSLYPGVPFGYEKSKDQSQIANNPFAFSERKSALRKQLYLIAGLAVFIIFGSMFFVLRKARKNP